MYIYRYYFIYVYPPAALSLPILHPEKAINILAVYHLLLIHLHFYVHFALFLLHLLSDISVSFQFLFAFVFFAHF